MIKILRTVVRQNNRDVMTKRTIALLFGIFLAPAVANAISLAPRPYEAGRGSAPAALHQGGEPSSRYAVLMEVRRDGGLIHRFGGIGSTSKPMIYGDAMGETGYQMAVECKQLGPSELSCSLRAEFSKDLLGGAEVPQFPAQAPAFNYKVEDLVLTGTTTEYTFSKDGYEVTLQAKSFE